MKIEDFQKKILKENKNYNINSSRAEKIIKKLEKFLENFTQKEQDNLYKIINNKETYDELTSKEWSSLEKYLNNKI